MKLSRKSTPENDLRWVVQWVNIYTDADIQTAEQAVVEAIGDMEDAIKNVGLGTNQFIVTDNYTGKVSIISSDVALDKVNQINTIINVDQSTVYAPSTTIYVNDTKRGKK